MEGLTAMNTLTQPPDNPAAPPPPVITPLFTRLLEQEAAARGLPPEPWAA
jgi:hypothetical protein